MNTNEKEGCPLASHTQGEGLQPVRQSHLFAALFLVNVGDVGSSRSVVFRDPTRTGIQWLS